MAAAPTLPPFPDRDRIALYAPAIAFVVGWLSLYAPVYFDFAQAEWQRDENAHAPFIMAICVGVVWSRLTQSRFNATANGKEFWAGVFIAVTGLALFFLGRASEATLFVSMSQTFVATGAAIAFFGLRGVKAFWFPLALTFYLIIWPSWALNALTAPLKQFISEIVSNGLFLAGLPVAHSGAVITAGQYQLLVADACAGLNSLIALTTVGAVYLYLVKRRSLKTNIAVVMALIPIALFANLVRVTLLVLLTYFFGYDTGQGFLHEGAGLLMFVIALVAVFAVDSVAAHLWEPRPC